MSLGVILNLFQYEFAAPQIFVKLIEKNNSEWTTFQEIEIDSIYTNITEATFEDIWALTSTPKPWKKVYQIQSGNSITITMPESKTTYIKYLETKRLKVINSNELSDTEPWFLKVTNGSFTALISTSLKICRLTLLSSQAYP